MATLVTRKGGNRHALNKLYRGIENQRKVDWIVDNLQNEKPINPTEDPFAVALRNFNEDADIIARRAAFPLH